MNYKKKTLEEFSNSVYRNITGDRNFDNVPSSIWNLWYNPTKLSIHYLANKSNATDNEWKELYDLLEVEFAKL